MTDEEKAMDIAAEVRAGHIEQGAYAAAMAMADYNNSIIIKNQKVMTQYEMDARRHEIIYELQCRQHEAMKLPNS